MARTIMVSNKVYHDLKKAKGERSFSETIAEALEKQNHKEKTIGSLARFGGVFSGDKEYEEAFKFLRKMQKLTDDAIWKK